VRVGCGFCTLGWGASDELGTALTDGAKACACCSFARRLRRVSWVAWVSVRSGEGESCVGTGCNGCGCLRGEGCGLSYQFTLAWRVPRNWGMCCTSANRPFDRCQRVAHQCCCHCCCSRLPVTASAVMQRMHSLPTQCAAALHGHQLGGGGGRGGGGPMSKPVGAGLATSAAGWPVQTLRAFSVWIVLCTPYGLRVFSEHFIWCLIV
jgi:hypothetical protein